MIEEVDDSDDSVQFVVSFTSNDSSYIYIADVKLNDQQKEDEQ